MFAPLSLSITALTLTSLFVLLLMIERARGVRYARGVREAADRGVLWVKRLVAIRAPRISGGAVRAAFHYLAHQCLSLVLRVIRKSEQALIRIVHFNRSKALHAVRREPDPHLRAIAEHKESVSLTAAEKRKRKNQALRGEW